MRIAICEDNVADLNDMYNYIKKYCEENHFLPHIFSYNDDGILFEDLLQEKFDMIFMNVMVNNMSGLSTARKIREKDPTCIMVFVAASKEYALDAYSVDAISYILKPVQGSNLKHALDKCRHEFMKKSRFIMVPTGRQNHIHLPFANINYVEVYGREVWFHIDSRVIKTSGMTLSEVERELGGEPFLRCHRCYIVNMSCAEKLQDGAFLIKNGDNVPIRKRGYSQVQHIFNQFVAKSGL